MVFLDPMPAVGGGSDDDGNPDAGLGQVEGNKAAAAIGVAVADSTTVREGAGSATTSELQPVSKHCTATGPAATEPEMFCP